MIRRCHLLLHFLLLPSLALTGQETERGWPFVVAHRGLLLDAPENTLANFRACLELRTGFEVDVRRSKDGRLVCIHDETVDRTTDGRGVVSELTLGELRALDAGSWFHPSYRRQRVPSLEEVFELLAEFKRHSELTELGGQNDEPTEILADAVLVAIDIKGNDENIEADITALARQHGVLDCLVMIGRAIDQEAVRARLRHASTQSHIALLANTSDQFGEALRDRNSDWIYVRYLPSDVQVAQAHAAGKRVFIAGLSVAGLQRQNWRRAAFRGVDAILTDYSTELTRQLRSDSARHAAIESLLAPHFSPPETFRDDFGKYRSPLKTTDGRVVDTAEEWSRRRDEILEEWHDMMGPWPKLLENPQIKYVASQRRDGFTQHRVHVEVYPGDMYAEGHLLVPDGEGPFPAVLVPFYDSATSVGLSERGRGTHDYGLQLALRGFVTLSIGTPGSIESTGKSTRELLTEVGERHSLQPISFLAYAAANCHTVLANLPQTDAERIGIVGLSYGGKWAMFASCLYEKFACAVWSDPGVVFNEANSNVNYWEPWYLGYEKGVRRPPGVPNDDRPRTGLYRRLHQSDRDLNDLHALICPRPVLVAGGTEDPPQNWRALNHLVAVNKVLRHENRVAMTSRKTHVPSSEALEKSLSFLEYFLKYH